MFALVITVTLFVNNAAVSNDDIVIDTNLSAHECFKLMSAYEISAQKLSDELRVHHTIACELQK